MGTVLGTAINPSPTIVMPAKAAITNPRYLALAVDSGKVKLPAAAGDCVIGIAIGENDSVAADEMVDIQIKDIGKWIASASIAVGAELTADTAGKAKTASAGDYVLGVALTAASAAGDIIQVQITKSGYKPTAPGALGLNDLSDVDTTGVANGKILKYNGTKWAIADDATE